MTDNRFIKVINNMSIGMDGSINDEPFQYELIPVQNLVKVYRFIEEEECIIAYVWNCPVRNKTVEYYERLTPVEFMDKLVRLERFLSGVVL